jgi:hypothetical protein
MPPIHACGAWLSLGHYGCYAAKAEYISDQRETVGFLSGVSNQFIGDAKMKRFLGLASLLAGKADKRFARACVEPQGDGPAREGFVGNPLTLRGLFLS